MTSWATIWSLSTVKVKGLTDKYYESNLKVQGQWRVREGDGAGALDSIALRACSYGQDKGCNMINV